MLACELSMQMAQLFDDFLHSPGIDPQIEEYFRLFLTRQQIRCLHVPAV